MVNLIVAGACLLSALFISLLRKAYFYLPTYELKREAASGEKFARSIYPAVAYPSLRGLLWLLMSLLSATGLILFARREAAVYGIIAVIIWLWLIYSWLPNQRVSRFSRYLASLCAPLFVWLFSWAHPVLKQFEWLQKHYQETHTELYENEDLRRFLRHQARQPDNRISTRQLMRLSKLVAFEEATVNHFAKSWKSSLKLVESDMLGPKLLDEMHRSKATAFAVTNHKNSRQIVGVLSRDMVGLESEGRVSNFMRRDIESIGRDEPIEEALLRFAHSSVPLLIVLDKENEVVATLSLSDALDALLVLDEIKPEATEPESNQEVVAETKQQEAATS